MRRRIWFLPLVALTLWLTAPRVEAQGLTRPKVRDTNVGYIDPAIPGDVFRLRFDAAYDNVVPTLADFFWTPGPPFGSGPSIPERSVDYQDLSAYFETLVGETTSLFADVPVRFLDPELNPNTAGLGDMNFGIKQTLVDIDDFVATFQFRTYVPSADAKRGLGNNHVSLEPALLIYQPITERLGLEAELRDWIPLGGTDFAGNIIRYGLGAHYDLVRNENFRFSPVAEFVGWSILGGQVALVQPARPVEIDDAAGRTIVNGKFGVRMKFGDSMDLYTGYGTPLTGDRWYRHVYRFELRYFY
jgi:hypothetical protein